MSESLRAQSKIDITSEHRTLESVQVGALLRIADATEVMAKNHQQLINDRDWYKKQYEEQCQKNKKLRFSIAGYKAWITILRRKLT